MRVSRRLLAAATCAAAAMLLPSAALAAPPAATTGGADQIGPGGARLSGTVDPNGEATRFYFQYGPTRRYGSRTAEFAAGAGGAPRQVRTRIGGLNPNRTYHYRLVATNASGVRSGANRSFRTRPQPLALQIAAAPNPVTFGLPGAITGRLTGTGSGNRQVQLQSRAFPYTGGFQNLGNAVVTNPDGTFTFPLPLPAATAQYRAFTPQPPRVVSPIVALGVAVRVGTKVSTRRPRRGRRVRFRGKIRPARAGAQFAIQKLNSRGGWSVIAGGITRGGDDTFSRYVKRVRVRRGGRYRVFVSIVDGNLVSGIGREIRIRSRRR